MRLDIRYDMTFTYPDKVREAHNEVRVRPRDLPQQRLLAYRLTTLPAARVLSFTDYWGTSVEHFGHVLDHDRLEIVAESAVETREIAPLGTAPMSACDDAFRADHAEYLSPSAHVAWDRDIEAMIRNELTGVDDVTDAVAATVSLTRSHLSYERDATHIGITLPELLEGRRGVCQDYAHLTIGFLRAAGIPARYVSGYLFATDETTLAAAGDLEHTVEVQTHAWVEASIPGEGWLAVDPTNDQVVGERHVVVGFGRDYEDVAPVRGVYLGEATPEVEATVEMRRMEPVQRTLTERPRRRHVAPSPPRPADIEIVAQQQQQ